mmetsp:Transcript_5144/g.14510  ORF Transcript_5144/g.14510 Transcript_5144/m.14510 type:complete len:220 (+) Transcript_5144:538-1197(+)
MTNFLSESSSSSTWFSQYPHSATCERTNRRSHLNRWLASRMLPAFFWIAAVMTSASSSRCSRSPEAMSVMSSRSSSRSQPAISAIASVCSSVRWIRDICKVAPPARRAPVLVRASPALLMPNPFDKKSIVKPLRTSASRYSSRCRFLEMPVLSWMARLRSPTVPSRPRVTSDTRPARPLISTLTDDMVVQSGLGGWQADVKPRAKRLEPRKRLAQNACS